MFIVPSSLVKDISHAHDNLFDDNKILKDKLFCYILNQSVKVLYSIIWPKLCILLLYLMSDICYFFLILNFLLVMPIQNCIVPSFLWKVFYVLLILGLIHLDIFSWSLNSLISRKVLQQERYWIYSSNARKTSYILFISLFNCSDVQTVRVASVFKRRNFEKNVSAFRTEWLALCYL